MFFIQSFKENKLMLSNFLSCTCIARHHIRLKIACLVLSFHESQFPFLLPSQQQGNIPAQTTILNLTHQQIQQFKIRPDNEIDCPEGSEPQPIASRITSMSLWNTEFKHIKISSAAKDTCIVMIMATISRLLLFQCMIRNVLQLVQKEVNMMI